MKYDFLFYTRDLCGILFIPKVWKQTDGMSKIPLLKIAKELEAEGVIELFDCTPYGKNANWPWGFRWRYKDASKGEVK